MAAAMEMSLLLGALVLEALLFRTVTEYCKSRQAMEIALASLQKGS